MTGGERSERRKDPRIPVRFSMAYRTLEDEGASNRTTAAETLNLSASGLCFLAPEALAPETHVALELALEGETDPVVALGRVVWCDGEGESYRVGVCFSWVREEDRRSLDVIAAFVSARLGS